MQNNQMQTFQELINCIEQASNQIQLKDKKIEELLNIIRTKENIENKNRINNNNKEQEKNIIFLENENQNLKKELQQRENLIININKEKYILLEKKGEYDNRITGMTKLINKMKAELGNINTNKENELKKIINENNILKSRIQSLENSLNISNKSKKELEESINKIKKEFNEKYDLINKESNLKINELQNEIGRTNQIRTKK